MARSPRILFVSAFETPFIRADLDFFRSQYDVTPSVGHGTLHLLSVLLNVFGADVVFAWFASVYGAVAVLWGAFLGKKTILQLGGVDMANDPGSGYGTWTSRWKSALIGRALRMADYVLVVDPGLGEEAKVRAGYEGGNIELLETRFHSSRWTPAGVKERVVVSVAAVSDEARIHIKGIDTLLRAAKRLPDVQFHVIGIRKRMRERLTVPENVRIDGESSQDEVLDAFRRAKVYCQPSRREGLSNALCEAMLCECIPVATDVGGSRRAVGETGFLVPPDDPSALADALLRALIVPDEQGRSSRERIIHMFPEGKRDTRLRQLIEEEGPSSADSR